MKKIKYLGIFLCALFLLSACEKETEGVSGILHFKFKGDETLLVTLGTSYVEPGYYVAYKGHDITSSVKVQGTVDANKVGIYPLEYSIVNEDGVKTSRIRTVIVADPTVTTDISGQYVTAPGTNRLSSTGTILYPGFNVTITKIASGFFKVSDFFGGFYDQRAKYGSSYACYGYVQLKNDHTLTLLSSSMLPWGDTLSGLSEGMYNPTDDTVQWVASYAGMKFTVILTLK